MIALLLAAILAHSWYSYECCSENDCAPVPMGTLIRASGDGYDVTLPNGLLLHAGKNTLKVSQDGLWHVCIIASNPSVRCLYVPGMA